MDTDKADKHLNILGGKTTDCIHVANEFNTVKRAVPVAQVVSRVCFLSTYAAGPANSTSDRPAAVFQDE